MGARARLIQEVAEMMDQTRPPSTVEEVTDRIVRLWILVLEAADIIEWVPGEYPSQDMMTWTSRGEAWRKLVAER